MDLKYHITDSYSPSGLVDEFIRRNITSIFDESYERHCPHISLTDFMNMRDMRDMNRYAERTFDEIWLSSPRKFAYELDGTRFIYVLKVFKSGPLLETERTCYYLDSNHIWNAIMNRSGHYTYVYDSKRCLMGFFNSEEEALDDAFNRIKQINGEILKALTEMKENLDEIVRNELIQISKRAKCYLRSKCESEYLDEQIESLKIANEVIRPQPHTTILNFQQF